MYVELHPNPIINEILCVPFENLRLNGNTHEKCVQTFRNIPDEATIIYSPSEEGIVVLGYYTLNNQNMSESNLYSDLRESTKILTGNDPHQSIISSKCIKINKWLFDNSLKNKKFLSYIFSVMIASVSSGENELKILWCDNDVNELVFYPISNDFNFYPFAENYFSIMFLNIK